MARRRLKPKFDKKTIIDAFAEMAKEKSIDRDLLQGIVVETLSLLVRKRYGASSNFDIIVNMDKGDIEIYLIREIVETPEDPNLEISLEEAQLHAPEGESYSIGEEFIEEITLENISDSFGRRLISLAAQNLSQRIREVEKNNIFTEYQSKIGEILVGEIYQVRKSDIIISHNRNELRMPREEQIPNEQYRHKKNQAIKSIIKDVRPSGGPNGGPDIILSRASEMFLARLFEIEIPEIGDNIIQIAAIARDPGERAKVAVSSFDERVDPVGACVGMKGVRIHSIVRELNNESIDLIEYSTEPTVFITRALSPAKVKEVSIDFETKTATVTVPEDQVSLAIGKSGQNVRLASKLTGFSLTLVKEGGEDIELSEFEIELGKELYDRIRGAGINSAREFLDAKPELILKIEGMSLDLALELRSIMLVEFEEKEKDETVEIYTEYANKLTDVAE